MIPTVIKFEIKEAEKLAEPARLLVERLCNGFEYVGATFLAERHARALQAAKNVEVQGEIYRSDLRLRADFRQETEALVQQQNLEAIALEAAKALPPDAKPDSVDDDWLSAWSQRARNVSDEQMRQLWAKLLTREATTPGSVSRRALSFVESLDQRDATAFAVLCQFIMNFGAVDDWAPVLLIWNFKDEPVARSGLDFSTIHDLQALGLITINELAGFTYGISESNVTAHYFGARVTLELSVGQRMEVGKLFLTKLGREMSRICQADRNDEFLAYAKANLGRQGVLLA